MSGPAFIFARGGSKGVPDKNVKQLAGTSLIGRAVECALSSKYVDTVIVSTDSPKIAEAAKSAGASVPFMRPAELATDDSPEILSWRHAIDEYESRTATKLPFFLSVPTTAPLRSVVDIDSCIELFLEKKPELVITVTPSSHSPWFNMVKLDSSSKVNMLVPPLANIARRQDVPKSFNITTVAYVGSPDYIRGTDRLLDGNVLAVEVPEERALDIDTSWDFMIAEHALTQQ